MIIKKIVFAICLFFLCCNVFSQEFRVNISVSASQIQGTDKEIYNTIQSALNSFVNDKQWTSYHYEDIEKIEGSITINVRERSSQEDFKGDLYVQLRRPVYGSTYTTTMLNTEEKDFTFKYLQGQNVEFDENNYTSNLLSTVAFYLNYFLALDGDSYSLNGGSKYFQTCQNIVTAAQRSANKGWKRAENNTNKYWMIENYTNSTYSDIHNVWYQYHRMGLDMMGEDNQAEARNNIFLALKDLKAVNMERSGLVCVQQFIDAKADEIVNIYKGAPSNEQTQVIAIMKEINPANTTKYEQINQSVK
ncbi:MAG: DUF4835 family protein [Bacteroidales bacterium]|jgi:hypothetical protein|nr:DUF4835 family protein [Bacteroidales bacterium]